MKIICHKIGLLYVFLFVVNALKVKSHEMAVEQSRVEVSDESLMEKYQEGDIEAFNMLYNRYSKKLYGYLFKKLKYEQDINEVFQLIFLKIHQSKHQFNSSFKFAPWFFSIAYNSIVDFIRKNKNDISIEDIGEIQDSDSDNEKINYFELVNFLHKSNLSEKESMALRLKYIEGHDYIYISNFLKLENSATRKLVNRAINKLKIVLHNASFFILFFFIFL